MKENTFANMEYVYEVYKEGSFSRAAANLYISQPAPVSYTHLTLPTILRV